MTLVQNFATEILKIKRRGKGKFKKGTWVEGPVTEIKITASVQPMNPNEVMKEIQGSKTSEGLKIFTDERLVVLDEKAQISGDRFEHDGKQFEIKSVNNWSIGTDLPHYECIAVKVIDEGGGA